ncbi:hypothetical protein NP493_301g00003 [Ridgeia piscesae]|uniref:Uncharacterized protein n=1 Tax=Ridgeia piscesae TaxID=27915 RepID=A0AAD9L7H6_RIDPI|nr:hypothetical protein NP493_301g00003 [Ridgeia piscesae]
MPRAEDAGDRVPQRGMIAASFVLHPECSFHDATWPKERRGIRDHKLCWRTCMVKYSATIFSSMHGYCQMHTATVLGSLQSPERQCALCSDLRGINVCEIKRRILVYKAAGRLGREACLVSRRLVSLVFSDCHKWQSIYPRICTMS